MEQIIRELKRQLAGEKLTPEQLNFHLTGVTPRGVPVVELTQPSAVRRHGKRSP
jgi:hypothetical protein